MHTNESIQYEMEEKSIWKQKSGTANGLGRFRYMTVSVQRGGHFRYMTTSVHVRSISVHVLFVVRLRYMRSTISVHYCVDIDTARERLSFYAELQMLNGCLVCYVKLLMCNWTFLLTTSNTDHRRPIRERINVNKHVTSDVQVYVTEASWNGAARLPHRSAHCECQNYGYCEITPKKRYWKSRSRYGRLSRPQSTFRFANCCRPSVCLSVCRL